MAWWTRAAAAAPRDSTTPRSPEPRTTFHHESVDSRGQEPASATASADGAPAGGQEEILDGGRGCESIPRTLFGNELWSFGCDRGIERGVHRLEEVRPPGGDREAAAGPDEFPKASGEIFHVFDEEHSEDAEDSVEAPCWQV